MDLCSHPFAEIRAERSHENRFALTARVRLQFFKGNELERSLVRGGQNNRRGYTGIKGLHPTQRAQAPTIAGPQSRKTELGSRRAQVVARFPAERKEGIGQFRTNHVSAQILQPRLTPSGSIKPRHRSRTTGAQGPAHNISRIIRL